MFPTFVFISIFLVSYPQQQDIFPLSALFTFVTHQPCRFAGCEITFVPSHLRWVFPDSVLLVAMGGVGGDDFHYRSFAIDFVNLFGLHTYLVQFLQNRYTIYPCLLTTF